MLVAGRMEFCPKCGGFMTSAKTSSGVVLVCRKCGYRKMSGSITVNLGKVRTRRRAAVVVDESDEASIHPKTTDVVCPQCGNREAYWWTVQTRSADEPMTQFFRCTKCGHTWREYA